MIRMTLLLVFGIGVTMMIYGNDTGLPQGSDDANIAVTRIDSSEPGLLTRVGTLIETATPAADTTERVPLSDEKRAIEVALAATRAPSAPAPAKQQTVRIGGSGETTTVATTAQPQQDGVWYVTGTTVNLRGGPSTSNAVVGRVRQGQEAEVLEETADGWFRIRTLDDGQNGYIFGRFLSQNRPG